MRGPVRSPAVTEPARDRATNGAGGGGCNSDPLRKAACGCAPSKAPAFPRRIWNWSRGARFWTSRRIGSARRVSARCHWPEGVSSIRASMSVGFGLVPARWKVSKAPRRRGLIAAAAVGASPGRAPRRSFVENEVDDLKAPRMRLSASSAAVVGSHLGSPEPE